MLDKDLWTKIEAVTEAYLAEVIQWDNPPDWAHQSAQRLVTFTRYEIDWIIEREITILWSKIGKMRSQRLGVTVH